VKVKNEMTRFRTNVPSALSPNRSPRSSSDGTKYFSHTTNVPQNSHVKTKRKSGISNIGSKSQFLDIDWRIFSIFPFFDFWLSKHRERERGREDQKQKQKSNRCIDIYIYICIFQSVDW
jgi:hypothetical protein